MSQPLLVVPENPPDEGDFWIIGFNAEWLPVVLAGILALRDVNLWQDGEAVDVLGQIDTLVTLISTNLDP